MELKIKRSQVKEILKSSLGTFLSVTFIKKDKTIRELNGRFGVTKHLRGGLDSTSYIDKYINIFDTVKEQYRKVNLETVLKMKVKGNTYIVEG